MKRASAVLVILVGASVYFELAETGSCPCVNQDHCQTVTAPPRQEVLGFSVTRDDWRYYDWTKITTIALFRDWDFELMCYAHSRNVRVVLAGNFPVANLTNEEQRYAWQMEIAGRVDDLHADGINFDIEEPIADGSVEKQLLVVLVNDTRNLLLVNNPHAQVTFDVAWSPDCIDGRCYDSAGIAAVTDFLVVMSYDERSQIFAPNPCIAGANSPVPQTLYGVYEYLLLGIAPSHLVLGQPWYGYDYPCESVHPNMSTCAIKAVPFRNASCSDAAGKEMPFSWIMKTLQNNSTTGRLWDKEASAPYFNYVGDDGKTHQVWYDDAASLEKKYALVRELKLRGVAFWTTDFLDYMGDAAGSEQAAAMWAAIDVHI